MKEPSLLGPDGKPLHPEREENIPLLIDTAVEAKVNTAMDNARGELAKGSWIKFGVSFFVAIGISVVFFFYGKSEVKQWTQIFVQNQLNEPMLRKATDEIMKSQVAPYVSNELVQAKQTVKQLSLSVVELQTKSVTLDQDIQKGQASLRSSLGSASDQIKGLSNAFVLLAEKADNLRDQQEFFLVAQRAQSFDAGAFHKLYQLAESGSPYSSSAAATINEVMNRLREDRVSLTFTLYREPHGMHFIPVHTRATRLRRP